MSAISDLVSEFVEGLSAAIEADVVGRVRSNVEVFLAGGRKVGGGGGAGRLVAGLSAATLRKRRKGPIQLCPVPGCKNRAAPVFGMVCSEHKNVAKSKIRKYREARKEAKTGKAGKAPKARKAQKARKARAVKPARTGRKAKVTKQEVPAQKRTARGTRRKAPARRPPAAAASTAAGASTPVAASA